MYIFKDFLNISWDDLFSLLTIGKYLSCISVAIELKNVLNAFFSHLLNILLP